MAHPLQLLVAEEENIIIKMKKTEEVQKKTLVKTGFDGARQRRGFRK